MQTGNKNVFDGEKAVRQIYRLFSEIEKLETRVVTLEKTLEILNSKLETNNEERVVYTDTK